MNFVAFGLTAMILGSTFALGFILGSPTHEKSPNKSNEFIGESITSEDPATFANITLPLGHWFCAVESLQPAALSAERDTKPRTAQMTSDLKEPLRCLITHNICGTDTHQVGNPCGCQNCKSAAEITRLETALAEATRMKAVAEIDCKLLKDCLTRYEAPVTDEELDVFWVADTVTKMRAALESFLGKRKGEV